MTDRLTDAELDGLEAGAKLGELVYCEEILPLVAEVREHRAARTLYHDEPEFLRVVRRKIDQGGDPTYVDADLLLAIIARITEEADRG